MIHLAFWLISLIIVLAIGVPLLFAALTAMTKPLFWLIIGTILMLLSWPLMASAHGLAVCLLVVGALVAIPGIAKYA